MNSKELNTLIEDVKEKIGEENSSKIADSFGILISDNSAMNEEISKRDKQIEDLQHDKETLIKTNGNLLLQVGMGEDDTKKEPDPTPKKFNFSDAFDEKGNFK